MCQILLLVEKIKSRQVMKIVTYVMIGIWQYSVQIRGSFNSNKGIIIVFLNVYDKLAHLRIPSPARDVARCLHYKLLET